MPEQRRTPSSRALRLVLALLLLLTCTASGRAEDVPVTRDGGVYHVPVTLNGAVTKNFVIDTGAAQVMIPADVYQQLVDAGTVNRSDLLSPMIMVTADGSRHKVQRFFLSSLRVGSKQLTSVSAAVGPAGTSPLLGQSFLERVGEWRLDARNQKLVLDDVEPLRLEHFAFATTKSGEAQTAMRSGTPLYARFMIVGAITKGESVSLRGQYRVESEAGRMLKEQTLSDLDRPWKENQPFPVWLLLSKKAPAGKYWITVRIEDRNNGKAAVYRAPLQVK